MEVQKKKNAVAALSVASNSILIALKLITGLVVGSVSIISEAIHSGVDLVAAIIALFAVRTSSKPADREHPFGHGKIENISGTIEAVLIFVAAIWIIYEAVHKLLKPQPMDSVGWGVLVMFWASVANLIVSHFLFKVGRETDSVALEADAWHLRTDVYTSLGVMTALGVYWAGHTLFPHVNLLWIDPVVAIAVACLITKAAFELTLQAGRDLLDQSLPDDEREIVAGCVLSASKKMRGFHHLRTRKAGSNRFIELHVVVDPGMTVKESHDIAEKVEKNIVEKFPATQITVHIEPCDGTCDDDCITNCFTPSRQKKSFSSKVSAALHKKPQKKRA